MRTTIYRHSTVSVRLVVNENRASRLLGCYYEILTTKCINVFNNNIILLLYLKIVCNTANMLTNKNGNLIL